MIPANDDPAARDLQRERILQEIQSKGMHRIDAGALAELNDEIASILAAWAVQDGVALDDIIAGAIPEKSLTLRRLWCLSLVVGRAHDQALKPIALAAAEHLSVTAGYGTAAHDAALRDLLPGLRAAVRERFSGLVRTEADATAEDEQVALMLAGIALTHASRLARDINARLRAKITEMGGDPDEEPPSGA